MDILGTIQFLAALCSVSAAIMFQGSYANDFGGPSGTQFGAGGGFVPSQAQETTPGLKKFGNTQTLRAVTIKQISEAVANSPDDIISVDGEELNNITIVGRVVRVSETATNLDLLIDDGTGTLEAKLYVDAEEEQNAPKRDECQQGKYVRIHGHLRPMDGKYPLVAFNIRQITDHNEVTYHLLSCIYQHGHFTRGAGRSAGAAAPAEQKPSFGGAQAGGYGSGEPPADPFLRAIHEIFNSASRDFSSFEIREALGGSHDIRQIRNAINQLADDGHVYSTTDDKWKSCTT